MPKRGSGQPKKKQLGRPYEPSPRDLDIYTAICEGDTLRDVGKKHKLSHVSVREIRDKVEKWLIPQHMDRIRQIKVRQNCQLDYIYSQSMAAWQKSKESPTEETDHVDADGESSHTLKKKSTAGDPAFLNVAIKTLADIRKIWGADSPVPKDDTGPRAAGVPYDQAVQEYAAAQIERYRQMMEPSAN